VIERRKALIVAGGSLAATAGLVALTFSLGGWAYHHRNFTLHQGRLQRLLEKHPKAEEVTQAILAEPGNRRLRTPDTEDELRALASTSSPPRGDEIVAKRRQWPELRIFGARDVVYFIYFDGQGTMRDFVCAGAVPAARP
jgi:hypothetical protein